MTLKLFPWDNGISPYWINPENQLEWYVDKSTTEWCTRDMLNKSPKLQALCFFVCQRTDDKIEPISRVLIDKKTNQIIAEETSLEAMAVKIDMFRLAKSKNFK